MKKLRICTWPLVAVLANGCALFHHHPDKSVQAVGSGSSASGAPAATFKPIITPDNSLSARVADYNAIGRFVVLSFPVGPMPKLDQIMFLYRHGLKTGEVKITGPQQDNNIVADLVTGTAQIGDEVRSQ